MHSPLAPTSALEGPLSSLDGDRRPSVYLAGFEVFQPDAQAHGRHLQTLCQQHGLEGLYPLDNALPPGLQGAAAAHWICQANLALIRRADAVLANLNPFRGAEPDSGTAFEVGFACALGKPVWCHVLNGQPLVQQVPGVQLIDGRHTDGQGYTVEDFGLPLNLMLACSARWVVGDAATALARLAAELPPLLPQPRMR